jgi:hypothetical protein
MLISHHAMTLFALITLSLADTAAAWHVIPGHVARKSTGDFDTDADTIRSHRRFVMLMMVPFTIAAYFAAQIIWSLVPVAMVAAFLIGDMALALWMQSLLSAGPNGDPVGILPGETDGVQGILVPGTDNHPRRKSSA